MVCYVHRYKPLPPGIDRVRVDSIVDITVTGARCGTDPAAPTSLPTLINGAIGQAEETV